MNIRNLLPKKAYINNLIDWLFSKYKNVLGSLAKYVINITWLVGNNVINLGLAMVISIFVARYLGPNGFGILSFARSFVFLFASLTAMSFGSVIVRDLAKNKYPSNVLIGTAMGLKGIGAIILNVLVFFTAKYIVDYPKAEGLFILVASAELFNTFNVIKFHYQATVLSKYTARVEIISNIIISIFKLLLIYFEASLIWFGISIVLQAILVNFGLIVLYAKQWHSVKSWKFDKSIAKSIFIESWPLLLFAIGQRIHLRVDQVMLGSMTEAYVVGQYAVGYRLVQMVLFIPTALMSTFQPSIAKAKKDSEKKYRYFLLNGYRIMFITFLVIALPIFFFGEFVIELLYGNEYSMAGTLFSLFSFSLFFNFMGIAKAPYFVNESFFKFKMMSSIIGVIINVIINYFLIPIYGAYGALIATYVSYMLSYVIFDLIYYDTRGNMFLMWRGILTFPKVVGTIKTLRSK